MINIPYRAARSFGLWNRHRFEKHLGSLKPITPTTMVPATVYSLSCERDLPEQAASIRSFLRFVGLPTRFLVISDGSYTRESRRLLEELSPCVSVCNLDGILASHLPARVQQYAAQHFLGKKLSLLMSLKVEGPTVYTDSDVLFFPGAHALTRLLQKPIATPLYLLDCWPSLDSRLIVDEHEKDQPVNAGFFILNGPLDWSRGLERLERMDGDCVFFTEQTLVHLAVKSCSGRPLPPNQFVLRAEDQFCFRDQYANGDIALRHYISSIRSKLWLHREVFA